VTVDRGAIDILMEEEQAEALAALVDVTDVTREQVADSLCALVADYNPTEYEDPTNATIVTPGGVELFVEVQASQQ
jgi:hypothetical protein